MQIKLNDLDTRVARIERVVANNSLLELSNQMGDLRADLRAVHNDIDELNHALETSRKQQRDLYADLDQRLKALEARSGVGAAVPAAGGPGGAGAAGAAGGCGGRAGAVAAGQVLNGQRPGPIRRPIRRRSVCSRTASTTRRSPAFQQFLTTYPDSSLADNAQYWLGEAYYVNKSFPEALAAFPARRRPSIRSRARCPTRCSRSATATTSSSNCRRRTTRLRRSTRNYPRHARRSTSGAAASRQDGVGEPLTVERMSTSKARAAAHQRDLPLAAGRGRLGRISHGVRAPDRLSAALPVLRYRVRLPRRRLARPRGDPRGGPRASMRRMSASPAGSRWRSRTAWCCSSGCAMRAIKVSLETSGAMAIAQVDPRVMRVVDVKTPGSGEAARNHIGEFRAAHAARSGEIRDLLPRGLRLEQGLSARSMP